MVRTADDSHHAVRVVQRFLFIADNSDGANGFVVCRLIHQVRVCFDGRVDVVGQYRRRTHGRIRRDGNGSCIKGITAGGHGAVGRIVNVCAACGR